MYSEGIFFFCCCVIEMFPPLLLTCKGKEKKEKKKENEHIGNPLNFLLLYKTHKAEEPAVVGCDRALKYVLMTKQIWHNVASPQPVA